MHGTDARRQERLSRASVISSMERFVGLSIDKDNAPLHAVTLEGGVTEPSEPGSEN
jgi:hypothetical protein